MADSPAEGSAPPVQAPPPDGIGGLEIERKWLVTEPPPDLERYPSERIEQGYLALDPEGSEVRLRRRAGRTLLTLKQGHGIARGEEEFEISAERFERLWAGTSGRRVVKTRYELPVDLDLTLEVDVYDGALNGLITAEVEFTSRAQADAFVPPPWLRVDLTGNKRFSNARMAIDGVPNRKEVGEHSLLEGEAVTTGLVHVALAEIDAASDALQGRDAQEHAKAVHSARKSFKRLRALVRVAKDGLGDEVVERDNRALQQAGSRLSGARDAQVVLETLDALAERPGNELEPATLGGLRDALVASQQQAAAEAQADDGAVDEVLAALQVVRADIANWDLGDEPAEALAAGFERIHKKGRKALKAASKTSQEPARTEALHELRKRAKDLWHAAELLEVAAPKRMRKLAGGAHQLADYLGDDHDLAVLQQQATRHADASDHEALNHAIAQRRAKLRRKGLALAAKLYAGAPHGLASRIRELDED
jgi:adenylate cyclase